MPTYKYRINISAILCLIQIVVVPTLTTHAHAAHKYPEIHYQRIWCGEHGGVQEYVLDDGARVDCLTDEYAIEFDFAPKWAEGIGQALYYAEKTGRKPGVVLIMENKGDVRYLKRLRTVSENYGINVWETGVGY